jgi:DNA-binding response OmpR family regulator
MRSQILVIDDETTWSSQFQDMLETIEFEVHVAPDLEKARKLLMQEKYDLVLMDMVLGDPSAPLIKVQTFIDFLRRQYPNMPVIATTGKLLDPDQVFALSQLGIVDFINKRTLQLLDFRERIQRNIKRPPKQNHPYDAFISYSHVDARWVKDTLLPRLEAVGLTVCIDFRDFIPGTPSLSEMERAVLESKKTLLVLSPEYLKSEWADFETIIAQTLDPAARKRRLIPLMLKPCMPPLRIRALTYIDLNDPEIDLQFQRLINAIKL